MSILHTQPKNTIPTNNGWVSEETGELLVGISNMVQKIKDELASVNNLIKEIENDPDFVKDTLQENKEI